MAEVGNLTRRIMLVRINNDARARVMNEARSSNKVQPDTPSLNKALADNLRRDSDTRGNRKDNLRRMDIIWIGTQ
jgi:hypothetical protein